MNIHSSSPFDCSARFGCSAWFGFSVVPCLVPTVLHGSAFQLCRVLFRLFGRFRVFNRLPCKEGQFYITNSRFTPIGGKQTKSILRRHATSFTIDRILVSMSDPFSLVWIFARTNSFSSTLSHNQ